MLAGVERLADLTGPQAAGLTGATPAEIQAWVQAGDVEALARTDGHFAAVAREGQTVRLARTIGIPLRYFVAKLFHGPFLIAADRIDRLYAWCRARKIGWQFDPLYTRMVPAHYLVEIDQVGCPDPNPRYRRFFSPPVAQGPADLEACGAAYVRAAYEAVLAWLRGIPADAPIAVAFSGGIDSTSTFLIARHALRALGRDAGVLRAFSLDLGGGADAAQAAETAAALGFAGQFEVIRATPEAVDLAEAIRVIEDYHPLDVECAAGGLVLLRGIRERYPNLRYLLDGDGGDENLKSYPLEDSDLTLASVLNNPFLYQEGWGIDALKHSLTYSGGLSRAYTRTYAPAQRYGFHAFSPYTVRSVIAAAQAIPFAELVAGEVERLYALKGQVVRAGIRAVTGEELPVRPKRRFQEGMGGQAYRRWRVSKAWCRQVFLRQWEERLREAWDPEAERVSGNEPPPAVPAPA